MDRWGIPLRSPDTCHPRRSFSGENGPSRTKLDRTFHETVGIADFDRTMEPRPNATTEANGGHRAGRCEGREEGTRGKEGRGDGARTEATVTARVGTTSDPGIPTVVGFSSTLPFVQHPTGPTFEALSIRNHSRPFQTLGLRGEGSGIVGSPSASCEESFSRHASESCLEPIQRRIVAHSLSWVQHQRRPSMGR